MEDKKVKKKKTIVDQAKSEVKNHQLTTRKDIEYYKTGITLLDLCLGGGLGKGYISNICGWEAAGKTILTCEVLGNNHYNNSNFSHYFDNSESGFTIDTKYLYGFDVNFVEPRSKKVEEFMFNFEKKLNRLDSDKDCIYVLDSLDGLSDDREKKKHKEDMKKIKKAMDDGKDSNIKGDYGGKAKLMSEFFRENNAAINKKKMHLLITSQLRDKPGVIYGKKEDRSGGKALNFYASQIIWVKVVRKITKSTIVNNVKYDRKYGNLVRVSISKNKLGKSFRECFLFFDMDMGVDNIKSNLFFLYDKITHDSGEIRDVKKLNWDGVEYSVTELITYIEKNNLEKELEKRVIDLWGQIEKNLIDKRKRKYK